MIYARLDTTTEPPTLDWGHAIYPAAGTTIEELGYLQFETLAEAEAYFADRLGGKP